MQKAKSKRQNYNPKLKRYFFFCVVVFTFSFLLFTLAPVAQAIDVPGWPLVPCGTSTTASCTRCDLFKLLKTVIDLTIGAIMPAVGVLLFVWAGFLILLSGGNTNLVGQGKTIFKNTFFGIMIMLSAWMITNTIIKSVGAQYDNADNWYSFTCVESPPVQPPVVEPSPRSPTFSVAEAQAKARELINTIGLGSFSTSADCGQPFQARQNIQDIATGKFPAVCSPFCSPTNTCVAGGKDGNVTANPILLDGLIQLSKRGIRFTVTSLTTGKHSSTSSHYRGQGVDIVLNDNSPTVWIEARAFLDSLGGDAFCEDKSGREVASCAPIPSVVDHIHWTK